MDTYIQERRRTNWLSHIGWYLILIGLAVGAFYIYQFYMIMTDQIGTFFMSAQVVDLDNDGLLDVVQHSMRKESAVTAFAGVTFWRNQDGASFRMERFEGGWGASAGDLDGDVDIDMAMYSLQYVDTFLNQGGRQGGQAGEFKQNNAVRPPRNVDQFGSLVSGDFNGDGKLDGFVAGCCGRAYFSERDATPSYSWMWLNGWDAEGLKYDVMDLPELDGLAIRRAVVGDLNGDDSLDIYLVVAKDANDPADRVLFNDGAGNLRDSGMRLGSGDGTAAALGDIDGDGDLDVLSGSGQGAQIWVNQAGSFVPSSFRFPPMQVVALALTDLDRDGDLDALIGSKSQAAVWWNDGQGNFLKSSQRFPFSLRHGLVIGDFNNDGWPDIFLHKYDDIYRLILNRGDGQFQ
jgi:hypothetical protein